MPTLFGYYDPDHLLSGDSLALMLEATLGQKKHIHDCATNSWSGLGIVNYPNKLDGIGGDDNHKYAVLGDLEALGADIQEHAKIAEQCFGRSLDTEKLVALRGGFAAAMLDERDRSVTLVTDRFGSYPLYIANYQSAWIFASQIKIILAVLPGVRKLDQVSVATMLSIGEVVGNRTLVEGIETLPAATSIKFSSSGVERSKYWQYVYEENGGARWDDCVDRVGNVLRQAVHRSLQHDESIAVPLSGGLDSRFILDLASQERSDLSAYTWGTPGCRDITYAKDTARRLGCNHEVYYFQPDYLCQLGERGVWLTEGHTPSTNFHVLPYVDELAARGHELILDGFAGDGVLGGNFVSSAWFDNSDFGVAAEALWQWRRKGFDGAWEQSDLLKAHSLAGDEFKRLYQTYPGNSSMDKAMAFLIDNRVRRITTCGTELFRSRMMVKQPFMDADVTEAIRTLPHEWRKRHRFYLAVLKNFAPRSAKAPYQRTMLPASAPYWMNLFSMGFQRGCGVLEKRVGFPSLFKGKSPSDFPEWFRHELRFYVEEILLSERTLSRGAIPADIIKHVLGVHLRGEKDFSSLIGSMISIELFARLFIDDIQDSFQRLSSGN